VNVTKSFIVCYTDKIGTGRKKEVARHGYLLFGEAIKRTKKHSTLNKTTLRYSLLHKKSEHLKCNLREGVF